MLLIIVNGFSKAGRIKKARGRILGHTEDTSYTSSVLAYFPTFEPIGIPIAKREKAPCGASSLPGYHAVPSLSLPCRVATWVARRQEGKPIFSVCRTRWSWSQRAFKLRVANCGIIARRRHAHTRLALPPGQGNKPRHYCAIACHCVTINF